ncbi:periplasmic chaperone for outer membrane proteins SurA [Formivibrio citricus]|uniref:Chaperone SurA n=1 Tax=Formivibrio citricus TaxID=83765 RepID=A0A1I5ADC4_9NEIS|nr:peptidylprolyl isomerase [Formivibrio citricus]SFN60417.1 periplasmic chaperone for outer membrane proteins SurA [Formivibrio citricus]
MKPLQHTLAIAALAIPLFASAAVVTADRVVAVVNRSVITKLELDERVKSIRQNLARSGTQAPPASVLEQEALDRMVTEQVLLEQAKTLGIQVDDTQLEQALARIAQNNKLTLPELRKQLEKDGINWKRFGAEIRQEMTLAFLREREIDNKVIVTDSEVADYLHLNANKPQREYRLAQIMVSLPENATPEQIQAKRARILAARQELAEGKDFNAVAAIYSNAPDAANGGVLGWRPAGSLAPAFVELLDQMPAGGMTDIVRSASGLHLFKLLDKREQSDKMVIRQTHARHILIRTNEIVSETDAQQKLAQIRARLQHNEKFEELARLYSDDTSAAKGGELGWISPGETVPDFEQAMNRLQPGEISPPVKSPFGFHLIQVLERRDQDVTQENRRMKVRLELKQRKAEESYEDWVRQLRDKAYISIRLKDE